MKNILGMLVLTAPIILLNGCGSEDEPAPVTQEEETEASESTEPTPAQEEAPSATPAVEEPVVEEAASTEPVSKQITTEAEKILETAVDAVAEVVETVKEESNSFTNTDVGTSIIQQVNDANRTSNWGKPKEIPAEEIIEEEPAEEEVAEEENTEGEEATEEDPEDEKTPAN